MAADPHNTGGPPGGFWRRMRVDTRPLRHRDFRNLWIGQAVSTIGGAIGLVAVPYQVYGSTALVVPLVGGAIADGSIAGWCSCARNWA